MAESKIKSDNFIVIQGWMLLELDIKGNELLIYACIYGFSQTDDQWFTGSRQYLAEWTNSTKRGIQKSLKSLIDKGLLIKRENFINSVKFCEYKAVRPPVGNKVPEGGEQGSLPREQSSLRGGEQSSPNNIDIHNINNNIEDNTANVTCKQIVQMYNNTCVSLKKATTLSEKRKTAIRARLKTYKLDDFKRLFVKAEASSFLRESRNSNWLNFDWLIKDDNMAKVLEGNYDDKQKKPAATNSSKFGDLSHLINQAPPVIKSRNENQII